MARMFARIFGEDQLVVTLQQKVAILEYKLVKLNEITNRNINLEEGLVCLGEDITQFKAAFEGLQHRILFLEAQAEELSDRESVLESRVRALEYEQDCVRRVYQQFDTLSESSGFDEVDNGESCDIGYEGPPPEGGDQGGCSTTATEAPASWQEAFRP